MGRVGYRRQALRMLVLAACGVGTQPWTAHADDRSWNNPAGGVYSNGENWFGGVPPGAGDTAVFNTGKNAYTVSFSSTTVAQGLVVYSDDVTLNIPAGLAVTLAHSTPATDYLVVGRSEGNTGALSLFSGTLANISNQGTAIIGRDTGSSGAINLGGTARWNLGCAMWLGNNGTGVFNQTGGSVIFSQVEANTSLYIGINARGTYHLSAGVLSAAPLPNFVEGVGVNSTGTFNQTGGFNNTSILQLGVGTAGVGRYILAGGSLSTNETHVGLRGVGQFLHSTGTHQSNATVSLGNADGGMGNYQLNGGLLSAPVLRVHRGSQFIQTGGTLDSNKGIFIGGGPILAPASISLLDGAVSAPFMNIGPAGLLNQTGSSLDVPLIQLQGGVANFAGGTQSAGSTTVSAASTFIVSGNGTRVLNARTVDNSGSFEHFSAALELRNGATIRNVGVMRISSEDGIIGGVQGGAIVNTGLITKVAGTGVSPIGGAITLVNNGGSVAVQSGSLTFNGNLVVGPGVMEKNGPGAFITNTGNQAWDVAATFRVNEGVAIFPKGLNPTGARADKPALKVNVATAVLDEMSFVSNLSINTPGTAILQPGGNAVLVSNGLDIDVNDGARLDVNDNTVIVDYDLASPLETIRGYLTSAIRAGAWNGPGLASTIAGQSDSTGLGHGEASELGFTEFAGISLDGTAVIVDYTYYGDANLDGQVDVADLGALASSWQTSGSWIDGDSDYSGFIDVADLGLLASNWQAGVSNPLGPSIGEALASLGFPAVAVPEPASLLLAGMLVLPLSRRRDRRCM